MRNDILRLLLGAQTYVSGEKISEKLQISRAAVWKNIKTVKEDGGIVEAVPNRGYRLISLPDKLKPEYLELYLPEQRPRIKWMESVDSTNDYAKKLAREGAEAGLVVIAENQTGGKGRLGRGWVSNAGEAVMMSFLLRPDVRPEHAPVFNLAMALGVVNGIKAACGVDATIKWPNDVVYGSKKLCGILTEMSSDMDTIEFVVCGAGTNVNQSGFPDEISGRATSLRQILGEQVDRVKLCAMQMIEIEKCFVRFVQGGTNALMEEYREKSAVLGKEITVIRADERFSGICEGFGANGELILSSNGTTSMFYAGEVSVRGVDDYV